MSSMQISAFNVSVGFSGRTRFGHRGFTHFSDNLILNIVPEHIELNLAGLPIKPSIKKKGSQNVLQLGFRDIAWERDAITTFCQVFVIDNLSKHTLTKSAQQSARLCMVPLAQVNSRYMDAQAARLTGRRRRIVPRPYLACCMTGCTQ